MASVDASALSSIDRLVAAIRDELPGLKLLTDELDRQAYRLDETAYLTTGAGLPGAVALPTTTAEVAALLRLASEHRVAVVPPDRPVPASRAA